MLLVGVYAQSDGALYLMDGRSVITFSQPTVCDDVTLSELWNAHRNYGTQHPESFIIDSIVDFKWFNKIRTLGFSISAVTK